MASTDVKHDTTAVSSAAHETLVEHVAIPSEEDVISPPETDAAQAPGAVLCDDPHIAIYDGVLPYPWSYRRMALDQEFATHVTGDETWHNIALLKGARTLPRLMRRFYPDARVNLQFFRKSPAGQVEPNMIHSDEGHGALTALLYLNPDPPAGDGTRFWKYQSSGAVSGSARDLSKDAELWEPWLLAEARFGRLVVFDSMAFHSRAIEANYGTDDESARLVQVGFFSRPTGHSIRAADDDDVPALVAMAERFVASTKYRDLLVLDPAHVGALAEHLIANPAGVVLVSEQNGALTGMLAAYVGEQPMSGERTAFEVAWWTDPEARQGTAGVRLFTAAETWARALGATRMQVNAPDERTGEFYERHGYTAVETAYSREL